MSIKEFSVREKEQVSEDVLDKSSDIHDLILFNDEVNTFDWVIETLIDVCQHDPIQAEQCAMVVHYKGKCIVKSSDWETLEPMQRELSNRELTAEID